MARGQALQASRYELKYVIDEARARQIADYVRNHLVPDAYALPERRYSYPVYSLYLDTANLALFRQTVQGIKNRFKLRIRFYNDDPDAPVFLEIKRRITDVIRKQRAAISRVAIQRLLEGAWPSLVDLVSSNGNGKPASALHDFCVTTDAIGARPSIYVSYLREAYVSPDSNRLRVTFDRHIAATRYDPAEGLRCPREGVPTKVEGTVLEVKFTDRFPAWMAEMVQTFSLYRRSVPKYVECMRVIQFPSGYRPSVEMGIIDD